MVNRGDPTRRWTCFPSLVESAFSGVLNWLRACDVTDVPCEVFGGFKYFRCESSERLKSSLHFSLEKTCFERNYLHFHLWNNIFIYIYIYIQLKSWLLVRSVDDRCGNVIRCRNCWLPERRLKLVSAFVYISLYLARSKLKRKFTVWIANREICSTLKFAEDLLKEGLTCTR